MLERRVRNVHQRLVPGPPEQVRPWLDHLWSGKSRDVFPHDWFVTWREHYTERAPVWIPGQTRFGHAALRFRLRHWDGSHFEADVLSRSFRGVHGFELERVPSGTRIEHFLEGSLHGSMRWRWPIAIRPLHDWAVEAMLDRLEWAIRKGQAPPTTTRPMSAQTRVAYFALDRLGHGALSGAPAGLPRNWGATAEEMRREYPCDSLIVAPDERLYRAVSVRASAARIFRWLCQLRADPYSYDWIDNRGRRSPSRLTPGLETLAIGQPVMSIFELVDFEPDRQLTLRVSAPRARRVFGDFACTYSIQGAGDSHEMRLVAKLVIRYPRSRIGRVMRRVLPGGDLIMMRKQLLTLKKLAERDERENGAVGRALDT